RRRPSEPATAGAQRRFTPVLSPRRSTPTEIVQRSTLRGRCCKPSRNNLPSSRWPQTIPARELWLAASGGRRAVGGRRAKLTIGLKNEVDLPLPPERLTAGLGQVGRRHSKEAGTNFSQPTQTPKETTQ